MVLKGDKTVTFTNNGAFSLILEWTATQSISSNNSTVTATLKLKANQYYSSASGWANKTATISINGNSASTSVNVNISPNQTKTLWSRTVTVGHNSDGTKSFSLSASVNYSGITWHGSGLGTVSLSSSYTLDTIPRASSMSVSPSTQNYGSSVTFKITRASSNFTHTIRYNFNGNYGTIVSKTSSTSYAWTVPNSFMSYIPNSTSTYGTIYIDTYSGSTKVGEKSIKLNTNIPTSIKPTLSSITIAETNSAVTSVIGAQSGTGGTYLQSLSRIKFTVNGASGTYSSSIRSTKISFNGSSWDASSATTNAINKSGAIAVTATITDSRGRSASLSTTITLTPYSSPNLTKVLVKRNDGGMGSTVNVQRGGTFTQILSKNKIRLFFDYKTSSTSTTWVTYTALTRDPTSDTNGTFNYVSDNTSTAVYNFLTTKAYPVRIRAIDLFGQSSNWNGTLNTAEVAMSWGRSGIGVGKIWEKGSLDLANDIYIGGTARILGSQEAGSDGNTDIEAPAGKAISLGSRSSGEIRMYRGVVFKEEMLSNINMGSYRLTAPRIDVHPTWTTWQVNENNVNGLPTFYLSNSSGGRMAFEPKSTSTVSNFYVGSDGSARIWSDNGIYQRTYSDSVNMFVTSAGTIGRSTSATKYKLGISEVAEAESLGRKLLTLNVKKWFDKNQVEQLADSMTNGITESTDDLKAKNYFGLIAEDLRDAGLEDFVSYNSITGEIEGIPYDRLWTILLPLLKRHEEDLAEQKAINTKLMYQIKKIENEV
ncbi:DUF859 family phage minor structural protein [Enterococcus sp. N249-2]